MDARKKSSNLFETLALVFVDAAMPTIVEQIGEGIREYLEFRRELVIREKYPQDFEPSEHLEHLEPATKKPAVKKPRKIVKGA